MGRVDKVKYPASLVNDDTVVGTVGIVTFVLPVIFPSVIVTDAMAFPVSAEIDESNP